MNRYLSGLFSALGFFFLAIGIWGTCMTLFGPRSIELGRTSFENGTELVLGVDIDYVHPIAGLIMILIGVVFISAAYFIIKQRRIKE
jgi:hypothetical protein